MFLGSSPLSRGGAKIYQPMGGTGFLRCDYSLYTDGTKTFKVAFVESPQLEAI